MIGGTKSHLEQIVLEVLRTGCTRSVHRTLFCGDIASPYLDEFEAVALGHSFRQLGNDRSKSENAIRAMACKFQNEEAYPANVVMGLDCLTRTLERDALNHIRTVKEMACQYTVCILEARF